MELFKLDVMRYRDDGGNPTCATDFENKAVCIFYATQRLGTHETCWFADKSGKRWESLNRREGEGTLIPLTNCPLWGDVK